ncbi:hypothetical protein HCC70_04185 [Streptococcus suis]|nr:hypothetical protein [Streptococcus suis]
MYRYFFSILQKCMLVLTIFWLGTALYFLFNLSLLAGLASLIFGFLAVRKRDWVKACWRYLMARKPWVMVAALLFQLLVLFSANLLVRSDAAVVLNGALKILPDLSVSSYLSRNPNNLSLFLAERWLYNLLGEWTIWVLEAIGFICMNATALILYRAGKDFLDQQLADMAFTFYMLMLGFSPYVIQTYTDVAGLPFLALQVYLILKALQSETVSWKNMFGLGLVASLAFTFRPTAAISIIAFFMVSLLKGNWKKLMLSFSLFLISFGLFYGGKSIIEQEQREVVIIQDEALAKSWLTFINLGLTYTGTDQEDMKAGLLTYIDEELHTVYNNGMFANKNEWAEIKRRLSEYTVWTFAQHLVVKLNNTLYDGTLNWIYRSPELEKTTYISPLYPLTQNNGLAQWVRETILEKDGENFKAYQLVKQICWILLVIGLVYSVTHYVPDERRQFVILTVFGGILFLMIFEGGKARYLLQFLPQIVFMAAFGWSDLVKKEGRK